MTNMRYAFESLNCSCCKNQHIFAPAVFHGKENIMGKCFSVSQKKGGVWVMLSICFRCTAWTSFAIFYEAEDKTKREKIPHLYLLHKFLSLYVFLFYKAKREKYLIFIKRTLFRKNRHVSRPRELTHLYNELTTSWTMPVNKNWQCFWTDTT